MIAMTFSLIAAAVVSCDVAVVGGGSAGFAAALAAAESGCKTVLIEKEPVLGGTSTICGVNSWEPVCGATGTPRRVYERLAAIPNACGIWGQALHSGYGDSFPGALLEIDPALTYEDTLCRHGPDMMSDKAGWLKRYHGIVFEPAEMDRVMRQMLAETGRCRVMTSTAYASCTVQGERIVELRLANGGVIRPKVVIDACGYVAKDAGCPTEMSANPNGASLIFRVTADPSVATIEVPDGTPDQSWWGGFPAVFCGKYPNGDIFVNMLPTMSGAEAERLGQAAAYEECRRRVFAQWKWMKRTYPRHFGSYGIREISPRVAYRETHRIVCEHMLTGAEVASGAHFEDEIATADHAFDSHGGTSRYSGELSQPYGIPLRSLKPIGVANMYVAGRIAGFDVDAATSCRLSRTMMQLGEAAGRAAAADALGAAQPKVSISVEGTEATIRVAKGAATDGSSLVLCYGERDFGIDREVWPNSRLVTSDLTAEGGVYVVELPGRDRYPDMRFRAFVIGTEPILALRTDNRAYIDLRETPAFDRRYEFRFRYDAYGSSDVGLFGGVLHGSVTKAFQLYCAPPPRMWKFYFSTADGGIVNLGAPEGTSTYDVKVEVGRGAQSVYWKKADETEYACAGTAVLESIPYEGNLYLFARLVDGNAAFAGDAATARAVVSEYKVTEISTGRVLKDLVPAADADGRGYMLDVVNDEPYFNAGSGAFAVERESAAEGVASGLSACCGVTADAQVCGRIRLTVSAGVSDGAHALYLVWGPVDGGLNVNAWEHSLRVAESVPDSGATYQVPTARLHIGSEARLRAVLVPLANVCQCCGSTGSAYIDLNENASSDRQYDIRFRSANADTAFMGGLTSDKSKILQLYNTDSQVCVWFGDTTRRSLFSLQGEPETLYDIRLVIKDGEQKAYYKKAADPDFVLGAEATLAAIPTGFKMALCGRFLGSSAQPSSVFRFARFTETEISTGRVIRDLVPLHKGDVSLVYDQANGVECPVTGGAFAYAPDTERTMPLFVRPTCATSVFSLPPPSGFMLMMM